MLALPELPEWLPPAVAEYIKSTAHKKRSPGEAKILHDLATDKLMKGVWRELKRRRFIHKRDYLEAFFPDPNNKRLSNSELEQKVSFRIWFSMAIGNHEIETTAEIKAQAKAYQSQAARLRKEIVQIFKHRFSDLAPEFAEHAKAIERVASWCDAQAKQLAELDPRDPNCPIVERDYGYLREMGLAQVLVDHMRDFYGSPLRGIVAIITTVALRKSVTKEQVRDWCSLVSSSG